MINKIKRIILANEYLIVFFRPLYHFGRSFSAVKKNYIFKKNSLKELQLIHQAFEDEEVLYWLEFGTLLGAVREKDFIEHDLDIDIGLFLSVDKKKIESLLKKVGFTKNREITIDDGVYGLEETYSYNGLSIDFFYFTKHERTMHCHVFSNEYGKSWNETINEKGGLVVYEHTFPYEGFKCIDFLGIKSNIPSNAHEHLKAQYGDNYMVKNKKWNPYKMATNKQILDNKIGVVTNYD
jgi:phosphorylcholine metabolism protein LicD